MLKFPNKQALLSDALCKLTKTFKNISVLISIKTNAEKGLEGYDKY